MWPCSSWFWLQPYFVETDICIQWISLDPPRLQHCTTPPPKLWLRWWFISWKILLLYMGHWVKYLNENICVFWWKDFLSHIFVQFGGKYVPKWKYLGLWMNRFPLPHICAIWRQQYLPLCPVCPGTGCSCRCDDENEYKDFYDIEEKYFYDIE